MSLFNSRMYLPKRGEPRQSIPQQPGRASAMSMPNMGMGQPGMGSQGMFNAYMSQLFNQKYAPPMMQGSPLQSYGGFFGFGSPQMPRMQAPQQVMAPSQMSPVTNPAMTWGEYFNAGS